MEKIINGAVLKGERPVHVGFAKCEFGFEEEFERQLAVVQAHGDVRAGGAGERMQFAVGGDYPQCSDVDKPFEEMGEQEHGIPSLSSELPRKTKNHIQKSLIRQDYFSIFLLPFFIASIKLYS